MCSYAVAKEQAVQSALITIHEKQRDATEGTALIAMMSTAKSTIYACNEECKSYLEGNAFTIIKIQRGEIEELRRENED